MRKAFEGERAGDHWGYGHTLLTLVVVVGIGVLVVLADLEEFNPASQSEPALWIWLAVLALMALFLLVVGDGVVGRLFGVLVGDRNRMSLARLQMAVWTILVLSAYLTAMLVNVATKRTSPLAVSIPTELWLAMGISTTSLLGSRLIMGSQASEIELREVEPIRGKKVATRSEPTAAKPSDLFCGDFEAGREVLDLTKVQMFFFTIVLVLGYSAATAELFVNVMTSPDRAKTGIGALPKLDEAFVILLAISHATYLTRKALPDTSQSRAAPVNTSAPTIEGSAAVGETLSAAIGAWTPEPEESAYRWERCEQDGRVCAPIPGAKADTYTLVADDAGKTIRVVVIGRTAAGEASAASALTEVIQP